MRRREFVTLLGGAAAAWPLAARAQQPAMPVIGYLSGASMTGDAGFQQGLKEIGLVEGRDFTIEYWSTNGQNDRLPAIVADVVARSPRLSQPCLIRPRPISKSTRTT
jgi:putative tryptophan/tyrosine transport system substrate-binding protein